MTEIKNIEAEFVLQNADSWDGDEEIINFLEEYCLREPYDNETKMPKTKKCKITVKIDFTV